jgi:hypothetical protein
MSKPIPIRKNVFYLSTNGKLDEDSKVPLFFTESEAWNVAALAVKHVPGHRIYVHRGEEVLGSLIYSPPEAML